MEAVAGRSDRGKIAQHGFAAVHMRQGVLIDRVEDRLGRPALDQLDSRPGSECTECEKESADPEERRVDEDPVARLQPNGYQGACRGQRRELVRNRRPAVDHRLGMRRAARGVHGQRRGKRIDRRGKRRELLGAHRGRGLRDGVEAGSGPGWRCTIDDDGGQVRSGYQRQHATIAIRGQSGKRFFQRGKHVAAHDRARNEQRRNLGMRDGVGKFGWGHQGAEENCHPANSLDGDEAGDP